MTNADDREPEAPVPSRFQVTRTSESVQLQLTSDLQNADSVSGTGRLSGGSSPVHIELPSYSSFDEASFEEESIVKDENDITTTTQTNSFYNTTIFSRYHKVKTAKEMCAFGGSLEAKYFPLLHSSPHKNPNGILIPYYRERVLVYNFLQRPTGLIPVLYHFIVSLSVTICLVLTIIATSKEFSFLQDALNVVDYFVIAFFIVEFLTRLWASECVSYYRGWKGKVRFFQNAVRIIDLIVIVVSLGAVLFQAQGDLLVVALRGVRFIQIFQMVRLDFKFRPWRMMASVVYSQRIHLAIVFYLGFLALIAISFLIYFVEKDVNPQLDSLAGSMWWAVITLTTIGYGDTTPITTAGKLLCCLCAVVGVSLFALPAGILGTGLALKVQEQQKQMKMSKRKQPAARVIQAAWRFYQSLKVMRRLEQSESPNLLSNTFVIYAHFKKAKSFKNNGTLSRKELRAIHFLFATKLSIARQDFVDAFKPYDIKDVLEQYAAGHADMLAKIKVMDNRLERIQCNRAQNEFRVNVSATLRRMQMKQDAMQSHLERLLIAQQQTQQQLSALCRQLSIPIDDEPSFDNPDHTFP